MLKEILEKIETEETPEVNESNYTYKWVGGSDDYKSIAEIEKIISEYNFYSNRIDNGGEHRDAVSKNKKLWVKLKKHGVSAIGNNTDGIVNKGGFDKANDLDVKYVK